MPALAVGAAVSAMVAQNIGAHRWDRVTSITNSGMAINLAMTGVLIALLLAFDRVALGLFLGSGTAAGEVARHIQYLATWTFLPFRSTMFVIRSLRAHGAVVPTPMILVPLIVETRLGVFLLTRKDI